MGTVGEPHDRESDKKSTLALVWLRQSHIPAGKKRKQFPARSGGWELQIDLLFWRTSFPSKFAVKQRGVRGGDNRL